MKTKAMYMFNLNPFDMDITINVVFFKKANVIVAEPYLKHGDDPYTLQYDECGQMGQYIHLTSKFLLDDIMIGVYGPRGEKYTELLWWLISKLHLTCIKAFPNV